VALFALALLWAQFRESGEPALAAHLELVVEPQMPARVYLFRYGRPFRLSPVQASLPLLVDLFYRDRLWRNSLDPETLEVTCNDQSHFLLLKGRGSFDLPAGRYRVEAYRGLFFVPAVAEFELKPGESRRVPLPLRNWAGMAREEWLSGDDHIHLTRSREDDDIFLGWLEAEDLNVANFLQLQRQSDAAVQYAFGRGGEAQRAGYSIRPGQESRSEFYGHVNLLGGRKIIRPVSIGTMYANSSEAYPFPGVLFDRGRAIGATVGYAHFNGSMPHSTLLMDLMLGRIDFVEVFQSGVLKTGPWYELLNAGFRITGIAGSDFPVSLMRFKSWPRWSPLLGPERTLVKARAGESAYETWATGVRAGKVLVTNGPLVELKVDEPNAVATASASFWRPIERLEIVRNGQVIASVPGDGKRLTLTLSTRLEGNESCWVAARTMARKLEDEPDIQAHTNPVYLLRNDEPVLVPSARETLRSRWASELAWYQNAGLIFDTKAHRDQFFADAHTVSLRLAEPRQVPHEPQRN
jgi:hypothetical protein